MGVSNYLKAFKLQMVVQAPMSATASLLQLLLGATGSETLNMRVGRICCLNNLEAMPLNSRKLLWNETNAPFPWQNNSPKRKGGTERVIS